MKKIRPITLHMILITILLTTVMGATLLGLNRFATLPNPEGGLTDWRMTVLLDIRWPRITLALLAGAVLGMTGNAMQGLLQNPLASPGLLGSSAGASTVSVFLLYYFAAPVGLLLFGGVVGALGSFALVYVMARRYGTTVMVLAGVAVNALLAAAVTILLSNASSPWALAELYRWLQGSLALAEFSTLAIATPFIGMGTVLIWWQRRYLDVLTFGEETASTMGIHPQRAFFLTVLGTSLCVGAIIPQTGVIGFIGLIAPHLARRLLACRPSRLYGSSALLGALLLLLADLLVWRTACLSRVSIGSLTAIMGAPCLLWILLQQPQRQFDDSH